MNLMSNNNNAPDDEPQGHSVASLKRCYDDLSKKYIDECKYRDQLIRERRQLRTELSEQQQEIDALQARIVELEMVVNVSASLPTSIAEKISQ